MDLSDENEDDVMQMSPAHQRRNRRGRRAAAQVISYAKVLYDQKGDDQPTYVCPECGVCFESKRGLATHKIHKHKNKSPPRVYRGSASSSSHRRTTMKRRIYSEDEEEEEEREESAEDLRHRGSSASPPIEDIVTAKIIASPTPIRVVGSLVGLEQEADDGDEEMDASSAATNRQNLADGDVDDIESEDQEQQEVENYPCKLCHKDRIFLTSFGLERHTKISHPDQLDEVIEDIKRTQTEKLKKVAEIRKSARGVAAGATEAQNSSARRNQFRSFSAFYENKELERRRRKGVGTEKSRGGALNGIDKEKENDPDYEPHVDPKIGKSLIQIARQQRAEIVASASFTEPMKSTGGRQKKSLVAPKAKYQSCDICGILINTEHPRAMESHTKAHQKNQELRDELLRLYGPSWVDNVTCKECNLVFKDDEKLEQHRRNVHVRRRHFLCRFCGDVFRNMRDLNLHKERRHDAFEGHRRHTHDLEGEISSQDRSMQMKDTTENHHKSSSSAIQNDHSLVTSQSATSLSSTTAPKVTVADPVTAEEFSCRSVCEVCGLQMVRPSNLIRHMKQLHDRMNFTATVETKGMPPFRIDVYEGRFMWGCCDEVYDDRHAFITHRRTAHGPQSRLSVFRECEHCGSVFSNNLLYVNHLRTHRPRICYICGETFGTFVETATYRAHMLKHKDQGYNITMSQINEDLLQKDMEAAGVIGGPLGISSTTDQQTQSLDDPLEDTTCVPDDQYSVFSESGVESECDDADSLCDEKDDAKLFTVCPVCDKRFDCVYRFGEHWSLHCTKPYFSSSLTLKTKPFSFKKSASAFATTNCCCSLCSQKFVSPASRALHFLHCRRRKITFEQRKNAASAEAESFDNALGSSAVAEEPRLSNGENAQAKKSVEKENPPPQPAEERASPVLVLDTTSRLNVDVQELEDCLDVKQNKRYNNYVEKAYIIEWDTNKSAPDHNPYLCSTCNQSFGDFLSLISHVKTHMEHPIYEKLGETSALDKRKGASTQQHSDKNTNKSDKGIFPTTPDAEDPARAFVLSVKTGAAVSVPAKFTCAICAKTFDDRHLYDEHLHLHHKNRKRHWCDVCGKRFWTRSGLKAHLQVHNTSKHHCSICEKKFATGDLLAKHQTVHELTNSVYQCEDCVQSLYGLDQLKRHFRQSHPGISIVTCPVCARIHTDIESVEEHFNAEHARTRCYCAICMKCFKTPMKCKEHVKKAHRKYKPKNKPGSQ